MAIRMGAKLCTYKTKGQAAFLTLGNKITNFKAQWRFKNFSVTQTKREINF